MPEERYDLDAIQFPDTPFRLRTHCILLGKRGSEAHGTYIPPTDPNSVDDRDLMGVCVPPADYYLGMKKWEGAESIKGVWDVVLYETRKFASLLVKQNPNVLSMLWLLFNDYLIVTPEGAKLIAARDLFRAREAAYQSFVGYARGQLKRMTHLHYQGYMGEKRKALVDKYGYDCKNAAHLVRLLTMGAEYLSTGKLNVFRGKDAERLKEIKTGKWPLAEVLTESDRLFYGCRYAYDNSVLPERIRSAEVNDLITSIVRWRIGP